MKNVKDFMLKLLFFGNINPPMRNNIMDFIRIDKYFMGNVCFSVKYQSSNRGFISSKIKFQ